MPWLSKTAFHVDWSDTDNFRDYWTRTPVTFEQCGILFSFNYGMEGKYLYADDAEIRLYNYNTLTLTSPEKITKVELTVSGGNHDNKTLVASEGELNDGVWTGESNEVSFASNYVSSTKAGGVSKYYYLSLSNIKVTVAPSDGIKQIGAERSDDQRIYNLMGVQMDEKQLRGGIYVKNGRKMVKK